MLPPGLPPPPLQSADLPSQVDSLLKAVEATNIFEAEMARRFEGAADRRSSDGAEAFGADDDDEAPASRVRQRYEKLAREQQRVAEFESPERRREQVGCMGWAAAAVGEAAARQRAAAGSVLFVAALLPSGQAVMLLLHSTPALQEHATSAAVARTNFRGAISSVFAPHLRCLPGLLAAGPPGPASPSVVLLQDTACTPLCAWWRHPCLLAAPLPDPVHPLILAPAACTSTRWSAT